MAKEIKNTITDTDYKVFEYVTTNPTEWTEVAILNRLMDAKKIILQLSVNNVTNKSYFTQRANSYPGPGIIPSEGRIYWASVILKL